MNFTKGGQTKTPQRNTNCQRSKIPKKNYKNIYKHNTKETEEQRQWRQNCRLN